MTSARPLLLTLAALASGGSSPDASAVGPDLAVGAGELSLVTRGGSNIPVDPSVATP